MTVTTHMCRGNFRLSWVAQGGYDFVADALFNELNVDGYFMEYDDERSGGFQPLRFVPKGKHVVLGLVTSKKGELEAKDDIKRRIEEASKFVDIDQLCLSPQCGFSSTLEGNSLSRDQQIAKLRLVVETTEEVWEPGSRPMRRRFDTVGRGRPGARRAERTPGEMSRR
jgi:5-methyltetrahydropteroyltriglutamate--homocysteine methyltransferase